MRDIHFLEFHNDIKAKYIFAKKICPILKSHNYKHIALEGFFIEDTIDMYKKKLIDEINDTKSMLFQLGLKEQIDPLFDSLKFDCFTYQNQKLQDIGCLIYQELSTYVDSRPITKEELISLSGYVMDSLINLGHYNLINELELMGFQLHPLEEQQSIPLSLKKELDNSSRYLLSDETIDSAKLAREFSFSRSYSQINPKNHEGIIIFTGSDHYKALQDIHNINRIFITSDLNSESDKINFELPVTNLNVSAENLEIKLCRTITNAQFTIITHYDKLLESYLPFFDSKCDDNTLKLAQKTGFSLKG